MRPAPLLVKIDRRRSAARSRRAEPQTSPPHATRLRALGRRHSLSTVAPPRRAARRPAPVQGAPWLCSSGVGRRRGRAAAARAVSAERVHTRTAQNEICGFGAAGGPYGRVWRSAKVESGRCGAPARRPQKPAGTLRLALLRPLKNPLRGSRPTWAVWAPRRRRPPDRSALLRFFDSQSNMGLPPPAAAGAAPRARRPRGDDAGCSRHRGGRAARRRASIGAPTSSLERRRSARRGPEPETTLAAVAADARDA